MQQAAGQRKTVFMSYSRADLGPVRALALALRRLGIGTWLDLDDLRPGQRWKEAIGDALAAADAMVFCVSPLSLASAWTGVEIGKARALAKPILPVAVGAVDCAALPEPLRELQLIEMDRHPPRHAAMLTARGIALALGVALPPLDAPVDADVVDVLSVLMTMPPNPPPEGVVTVDRLDFSRPEWIRLADLLHAAGRARRAELTLDAQTSPALLGLVLGTLCQAFGAARVTLRCGPGASESWAELARVAGVRLEAL